MAATSVIPFTSVANVTGDPVREIPSYKLGVTYPWLFFYIVVYAVIIFGSIVGNQLVIWSYIIEPKLQKSTNIYIVSLAVADFLTGLIGLPLAVLGRLVTGPYICYAATRSLFYVVAFMMCGISVNHLILITVDRYIAITRPLKYLTIMTKRKCKIFVIIAWVAGGIVGALPVLSPSPNPTLWVCGTTNFENPTTGLHRFIAVGSLAGAMVFFCFAYLRIFCVAKQFVHEKSERMKFQTKEAAAQSHRSLIKTTVTTAILIGAFAVCWLPTIVKFIIEDSVISSENQLFVIQTFAEVLAFANSMVNPIIYTFRNDLYRKTYAKIINKVFCRSKDKHSERNRLSEMSFSSTQTSKA